MDMTINDIIRALNEIGLGGTDAMTGERVISSATLEESINGDGGLTVSWKSERGGLIRGGTLFLGYVMKENYVPTLGSDGLYSWSPKFSEPAVLLGKNNYCKRLQMSFTDGSDSRIETSTVYTSVFAGKVGTIVDDLRTFFVRNGMGFSIEVRSEKSAPEEAEAEIAALLEKPVVVTFDGSSIKRFIDAIAEQAEANVYYVGRRIILGKTRAFSDTDFFNRFIVLGGTKNMSKRTVTGVGYAPLTQRLHLDETAYPGSVLDLRSDKVAEAPFETFLVFDDIYPKLNLTILSARPRLCYLLDENGSRISDGMGGYKLYAKWYVSFALGSRPYTIDKSYIIQDKPLSVLFQSGPLTGRQFEVTLFEANGHEKSADDVADGGFDVYAGECCIILEADGELLLPGLPPSYEGGGLCPNVGNWVTLVNVAIEDSFRTAAQNELLAKGMERARLIYESKTPSLQEERSFTDALTGEGSEGVPSLGEPYKGYVVTGVSTNLVTGVKHVSFGTFKPKGLMRSAIDKIESYTLSGGASTKGKEVSTKTDGGTTVIYIHGDSEGGDNSTATSGKGPSAGSTSQSQSTAIRRAGGNVNMKTVYDAIGSASRENGVGNIFAGLATELWKHRGALADKWDAVMLCFSAELPGVGTEWYQYYGGVVYYDDAAVTDDNLKSAFASAAGVIGDVTSFALTIGSDLPATPGKYDMLVEPIEATVGEETIEGGIRVWLYNGAAWSVVLTSTTSLIENLGDAVRLLVFGAADGSIPGMIEASGMLTTQNFVSMFSKATSGSKTLAEATFGVGIRYHVEDEHGWHDVVYDSKNKKWVYAGDNYYEEGTEYSGDEAAIMAYGFSGLSADMIEFNGKTIQLASTYSTEFTDSQGSPILSITGGGQVTANVLNVEGWENISGALTVGDKHAILRRQEIGNERYDNHLLFRTLKTVGGTTSDKITVALGTYEFGDSEPFDTNSYLELRSFKNDWSTELGHIIMRCGKWGPGTGPYYEASARSSVRMGVGDKDNICLLADSVDSENIQISVRGSFGYIGSSFTYLGIGSEAVPVTFTTADGKTVKVMGGIVTKIT